MAVLVGEKAIWGADFLCGWHDTANGVDPGWIGSEDFHTVCRLAGVDADAVIDAHQPERFMRMRRAASLFCRLTRGGSEGSLVPKH